MKYFLYTGWLLVIWAIAGCHYSDEYQVVEAKQEFKISVPPWMKEQDNLKAGAPFQYANRFRNFYAIGTAEARTAETLDQRVTENLNVLKKAMNAPIVTDSTEVSIGGLPGVRVEIYGKMNDENIYFSEVVLEGKKKYYHLSVWTRGEERKLRYKEDINKILYSFKEL